MPETYGNHSVILRRNCKRFATYGLRTNSEFCFRRMLATILWHVAQTLSSRLKKAPRLACVVPARLGETYRTPRGANYPSPAIGCMLPLSSRTYEYSASGGRRRKSVFYATWSLRERLHALF